MEIYRNAKEVLIWLGDEKGNTDSEMAVDLLKHANSSFGDFADDNENSDFMNGPCLAEICIFIDTKPLTIDNPPLRLGQLVIYSFTGWATIFSFCQRDDNNTDR